MVHFMSTTHLARQNHHVICDISISLTYMINWNLLYFTVHCEWSRIFISVRKIISLWTDFKSEMVFERIQESYKLPFRNFRNKTFLAIPCQLCVKVMVILIFLFLYEICLHYYYYYYENLMKRQFIMAKFKLTSKYVLGSEGRTIRAALIIKLNLRPFMC